jgi:hypothetical protein
VCRSDGRGFSVRSLRCDAIWIGISGIVGCVMLILKERCV